jgi:hypothetical protein
MSKRAGILRGGGDYLGQDALARRSSGNQSTPADIFKKVSEDLCQVAETFFG